MTDPHAVPPSEAPTIHPGEGPPDWRPHVSTLPHGTAQTAPGASSLATGQPQAAGIWLQPGSVVGGSFRVERELGRGAMGVVVLATHLALDRKVALKVHQAQNPEDTARLAREAKALAKVRHPNVVGIYDVRESDGILFIAMEYIEGYSARRWLASTGISWRGRLDVCMQAAGGLAAAHEAGLVHRDFKPENILIGADGRVLVADFGLARAPGAAPIDPATPSPGVDAQLTAIGAVTGTPAYMSPEQWSGGPVDARSDVFALSVVVYEALYGRRPFAGTHPAELLRAITGGQIQPPPEGIDVPKEVFGVLRQGMAVDPGRRLASVGELQRALRGAITAPGRAGVALAVGLAVVVFAGIGGAAWALKTSGSADQRASALVADAVVEAGPTPSARRPPVAIVPKSAPPAAAVEGSNAEPEPEPEDAIPAQDEIEDLEAKLEDLSERYRQGEVRPQDVIAAVQAVHAARRRVRDEPYVLTPWDGRSTFTCGLGQRVEIRDVQASLTRGPAIEMSMGCGLKLVNVDITAPIAIKGMSGDRLIIRGGRFDVSSRGIELGTVSIDIRDLVIEGNASVAADFGMHTVGTISGSSFQGLTALRVGMHGVVEVQGGTMKGQTAVDAQMHASVLTHDVAIEGKVKTGIRAQVARR